MASYKDTFESHSVRAESFACGAWRGVLIEPSIEADYIGLEYSTRGDLVHFAIEAKSLHHFQIPDSLLHCSIKPPTELLLHFQTPDSVLHFTTPAED
jgi:hypothetical protein